jgi:osmotically-inducible protein OsmY
MRTRTIGNLLIKKGATTMKTLLICLTLVFASLTAACTSTPTSRGTGQVFDDATITAKVKTAIAKSGGIGDAAAINVDTYRGVVSLAGFLDNRAEINTAVKAANGVEGVKEVKNNLQIKAAK